MKAIVIGATGAVGKDLVQQLIEDSSFERVDIFVRRIIFIHGVGDGTLAASLRKERDEVFALSCTYTFGPMGVTNVTIR